MSTTGGVGLRRNRIRPGAITLAIGLCMLAASVLWTLAASSRTSLGVLFGLVASYALSASVVFDGVMRMRDEGPGEPLSPGRPGVADGDAAWIGDAGRRSLRCSLRGHREVFVPRAPDHPPIWRCKRCGASSRTHLASGHAWVCRLPLVDHRYHYIGASAEQPERWRCRRCGRRRYRPPRSAGETLDATRSATMWIRRDGDG